MTWVISTTVTAPLIYNLYKSGSDLYPSDNFFWEGLAYFSNYRIVHRLQQHDSVVKESSSWTGLPAMQTRHPLNTVLKLIIKQEPEKHFALKLQQLVLLVTKQGLVKTWPCPDFFETGSWLKIKIYIKGKEKEEEVSASTFHMSSLFYFHLNTGVFKYLSIITFDLY